MRTKTDAELEAAEEMHANDPPRAELLRRARTFKASWLELAEALTDVRKSGEWRRWGYDSFEAYTKGELHLRQETVDKLTGSFMFLKKRAPEVLARDGVKDSIPSYQALDFLRRAEDQEEAPREVVEELRKRVFEDAAPMTQLNKQYRDVVFPVDAETKKQRDVAAVKNVANRLRELLTETKVLSRPLAKELGDALERALEALMVEDEKAA